MLAVPLGALLAKQIKVHYSAHGELPQQIMPVPLHFKRQLQRGYNQSALIAQELQRHLSIPVAQHQLQRIKHTAAQAELSRKERLKNLASAFYCPPVSYQHVAIVDDVVTTGATATQITKIIKKAGVKKVDIWCICRTEY